MAAEVKQQVTALDGSVGSVQTVDTDRAQAELMVITNAALGKQDYRWQRRLYCQQAGSQIKCMDALYLMDEASNAT